jgi:hypothetical protein
MSKGFFMTITNYLSPLEFVISVKRLPHVQFFTQRTAIPGISAQPVVQPTRFNPVFHTPDTMSFDNLNFSFIIDENMGNYIEVFQWLRNISFPESHAQFREVANSTDGLYSDISVLVLNSKKNPNIEIYYKNCFPISLSEVTLDTTSNDVTYPEATVVFQYDSYDIKQINK